MPLYETAGNGEFMQQGSRKEGDDFSVNPEKIIMLE